MIEVVISSVVEVRDCLNVLEADLELMQMSPEEHNGSFEQLREYTTKSDYLGPLSTDQAVSLCCRYGFDGVFPSQTARTAVRCLCNILLLAEPTRQTFVDKGYPKKALRRMENADPDDEFTSARLLFYCTYGTNLDFNDLFCNHQLAEIMNTNISRCAELVNDKEKTPYVTAISACSETLKLLYNLTGKYPHQIWRFRKALRPILEMLTGVPIISPPLQPPVSLLINALLHLDLEDEKDRNAASSLLFPQCNDTVNVDRLVNILDLATTSYTVQELDKYGSPLIGVLLQVSKTAPAGPRSRLCEILLPSAKDRESVLGKGDSLPSRLISLFNHVTAPHLSSLLPALYFELSDSNVDLFVHHVGYGLAAGFLRSSGVQSGPNFSQTRDTQGSSAVDSHEGAYEVNPITGQNLEEEKHARSPVMTDEEKEREAEKLFVLFERLRATGIMNVENPVTEAQRQGRFEELD